MVSDRASQDIVYNFPISYTIAQNTSACQPISTSISSSSAALVFSTVMMDGCGLKAPTPLPTTDGGRIHSQTDVLGLGTWHTNRKS